MQSISLSDQVFEKLEADIISGVFARGETFTEQQLADRLNVSRTPIREALRRLAQERLIADTGKGSVIVGMTRADLEDLMDVRLRVEGLAARYATANLTPAGRARLQEIVDLQKFYSARNDVNRLRETDDAFHEAIYELCSRPVLQDVLRPLHRKAQRWRRASLAQRGAKSTAEHQAICKAILAGDGDAADELMTAHIRNAKRSMLKEIKEDA